MDDALEEGHVSREFVELMEKTTISNMSRTIDTHPL